MVPTCRGSNPFSVNLAPGSMPPPPVYQRDENLVSSILAEPNRAKATRMLVNPTLMPTVRTEGGPDAETRGGRGDV
jgi:hypothetical protein